MRNTPVVNIHLTMNVTSQNYNSMIPLLQSTTQTNTNHKHGYGYQIVRGTGVKLQDSRFTPFAPLTPFTEVSSPVNINVTNSNSSHNNNNTTTHSNYNSKNKTNSECKKDNPSGPIGFHSALNSYSNSKIDITDLKGNDDVDEIKNNNDGKSKGTLDEEIVYIYILKLKQNKYYIGKTKNPSKRLRDHFDNSGCNSKKVKWLEKYEPIGLISKFKGDNFDENKLTKVYMAKYGIANVRGGSYCQLKLPKYKLQCLQDEIRGSKDECYMCGKSGHFIDKCDLIPSIFQKKKAKTINCYYENDIDGDDGSDECIYMDNEVYDDDFDCCFRCGRKGHWVQDCYAKRDVDGCLITHDEQNEQDDQSEFDDDQDEDEYEDEDEYQDEYQDDDEYEQFDGCHRCGRSNHSAEDCFAKADVNGNYLKRNGAPPFCSRCGRDGHWFKDCYATTGVDGEYLND